MGYRTALVKARTLPDLPVKEAMPALEAALRNGRSGLLDAPPGAGKSTLVPLLLLDSPWLAGRKILMLEPRRLAARAVAHRMAALLGEPVGRTVGFRTRLETRISRDSRIEVLTEGILTRMLQSDPALSGVGCVIFDEFHERSLNADLALALCIEAQQALREDLRILVMSATLDPQSLAKVLPEAPAVVARGRSFDVATHYVSRRAEVPVEAQMSHVIRAALRDHSGDVLCFLPGAPEIRRVHRALETAGLDSSVRVLPLYGELAPAAQDAALAPTLGGNRKVVLATSVAETSLTIEGIRVVIDSGLRRYSEFHPATGMSRLVTGKVSQASADQRRGRAGRLSEGDCYRLWSEGSHAQLSPQTPPEILHADLAPLALELACWGALDASSLAWIDQPPAAPLAQARDLLNRLDAIDDAGRVTAHGRVLAEFGMHPRLAAMFAYARNMGAGNLACDLAAILSERDIVRSQPGTRDVDLRLRAAVMRGELIDLTPGIAVDERALAQAKRSADTWRHRFVRGQRDSADLHEAAGILLARGYPDRIGRARDETGRYLLANGRGARFGEAQALSKSKFIVAAELDGADREARIFLAAPITAELLEKHFSPLITQRDEIYWDERSAAVHARFERRLGALLLDSSDIRTPDADAVLRAALTGLKGSGVAGLTWSASLLQWRSRVLLMRRCGVPAAAAWPDLSDAALDATMEEWASPWLVGLTRREHFARLNLRDALESFLTHAQRIVLEREAPTHFTVPSGSACPIDYTDGEIPSVSVRLQELFGLNRTPSVAGGKLPLLLKILSPAGRPVQITRDLMSFWERGYHEVKRDLKGRYPKHYWPDDPYTAQPTRRVRPR